MKRYDALYENEDDVFSGTPKSKFWDIINSANDEIVKDQMDLLVEKFTVMETLLKEIHGDEKLHHILQEYRFKNGQDIEYNKKSTYMDFTGEVISRLDS